MRYVVIKMQSLQYWSRSLAWNLRARATLRRCWCFCFTILFCWGVSTQLVWWMISLAWKKIFHVEFPPLSLRRILILWLNWFSTKLAKDSMLRLVSALVGRRYNHVQRVKQSAKVKKYLKPSYEGIKHSPYKKKGVMHDDCYKKKVIDEILLRDKCSKVFFYW